MGKYMGLFRTSMVGGLCLASLHFCWALLIALGWAQAFMDFIFKLHMINPPFQVQAFNPLLAFELVGITFLIGCFYGAVFYFIKISLQKR